MRARWVFATALAAAPQGALAQIITDGTLGSPGVISPSGSVYLIPQSLGQTAGDNLFHSFSFFDVPTGAEARFTGASALDNIITRVTGGGVSDIAGLVSVVGPAHANLYLINPAGIAVTDAGRFDVPGALYLSTAQELGFADGTRFSAAAVTPTGELTMAQPQSFGFLGGSGTIRIADADQNFLPSTTALHLSASDVSVVNSEFSSAGLSFFAVGAGNEVTLDIQSPGGALGGVLSIRNSNLFAEPTARSPGIIHLAGGAVGLVDADVFTSTLNARAAGDIEIHADTFELMTSVRFRSTIGSTTTGRGATGIISLTAHDAYLEDSIIITSTSGAGDASGVRVDANNLNLVGFLDPGGIFSNAALGSTGYAGEIAINADTVSLRGGIISVSTGGSGDAGELQIDTRILSVDGDDFGRGVFANSVAGGSGDAGDILIVAEDILLENGGLIGAVTSGAGDGGAISIEATNLVLNSGAIIASTNGAANAGDISIQVGSLSAYDNAAISVETNNAGAAGTIDLHATSLLLDHASVSASTSGDGNAGSVNVTGQSIVLRNFGAISSFTESDGDAGNVFVQAGSLLLKSFSVVSADVLEDATGAGGTITISADTITTQRDSHIAARTFGPGDAGEILIDVDFLWIKGGGVSSDSFDLSSHNNAEGDAGDITINAGAILIGNDALPGSISSGSRGGVDAGAAGTIRINAQSVALYDGGFIETRSDTAHAAGDVEIETTTLFLDGAYDGIEEGDESRVSSRSTFVFGSAAGSVLVAANQVTLANGGQVTTDSAAGPAGNVRLLFPTNGLLWLLGQTAPGVVTTSSGSNAGGEITIFNPAAIISDGGAILALGEAGGANVSISSAHYIQSADAVNLLSVDGALVLDASVQDVSRSGQTIDIAFLDVDAVLRGQCRVGRDRGRVSRLGALATGPYPGLNELEVAGREAASLRCASQH